MQIIPFLIPNPNLLIPHTLFHLHFDIGVRVAVSVHGSQMNTAHDTNDEPVRLRAVHEGHQNPATLLHLSTLFPRLQ